MQVCPCGTWAGPAHCSPRGGAFPLLPKGPAGVSAASYCPQDWSPTDQKPHPGGGASLTCTGLSLPLMLEVHVFARCPFRKHRPLTVCCTTGMIHLDLRLCGMLSSLWFVFPDFCIFLVVSGAGRDSHCLTGFWPWGHT